MMPPPSVGRGPLNFAIACEGGLRLIRTSPGLAAFAIGALALGIGFTTTMFGIVHGATRPLDSGQDGSMGRSGSCVRLPSALSRGARAIRSIS
jgi:hypothetical protein